MDYMDLTVRKKAVKLAHPITHVEQIESKEI